MSNKRRQIEAVLEKWVPSLFERDPGGERNWNHIDAITEDLCALLASSAQEKQVEHKTWKEAIRLAELNLHDWGEDRQVKELLKEFRRRSAG